MDLMMNKIRTAIIFSALSVTPFAQATLTPPIKNKQLVKQVNTVVVGYELQTSNSKDNNPAVYDQPYLSFQHTTMASWGSATGWLTLDNPLDSAENQKGDDAGSTVRAWLKLDHNIGDSPYNIWFQSFTMSNSICSQEDLYLGISRDILFGPLRGTFGVGAHYGWGAFNPASASYNGMNGVATSLLLGYPISNNLVAKLFYEAQFARSEELKQTFGFEDYGHLAAIGLDYHFDKKLWVGTSFRHRKSWGPVKDNGGNFFFEAGYKF